MMSDPKQLTKAEREEKTDRAARYVKNYGAGEAAFSPYRDKTGKLFTICELSRDLLRYEATLQTLESGTLRDSRSADDYANRNIRTLELANAYGDIVDIDITSVGRVEWRAAPPTEKAR